MKKDFVGADWAGRIGCLIRSWSRVPKTVACSSAGSANYRLLTGAAESVFWRTLARVSAATAMSSRTFLPTRVKDMNFGVCLSNRWYETKTSHPVTHAPTNQGTELDDSDQDLVCSREPQWHELIGLFEVACDLEFVRYFHDVALNSSVAPWCHVAYGFGWLLDLMSDASVRYVLTCETLT